jgi:2-oxoglutarate dehydrogenase complex dehydrogenase (E1) component-like enzyme
MLINEAAKHFWQATQKTIQKVPAKRTDMIKDLKSSDWGFTARLASAAATIISLKARDH